MKGPCRVVESWQCMARLETSWREVKRGYWWRCSLNYGGNPRIDDWDHGDKVKFGTRWQGYRGSEEATGESAASVVVAMPEYWRSQDCGTITMGSGVVKRSWVDSTEPPVCAEDDRDGEYSSTFRGLEDNEWVPNVGHYLQYYILVLL